MVKFSLNLSHLHKILQGMGPSSFYSIIACHCFEYEGVDMFVWFLSYQGLIQQLM